MGLQDAVVIECLRSAAFTGAGLHTDPDDYAWAGGPESGMVPSSMHLLRWMTMTMARTWVGQ